MMRFCTVLLALSFCLSCGDPDTNIGVPTDTIADSADTGPGLDVAPEDTSIEDTEPDSSSTTEDSSRSGCEAPEICFGDPCASNADCPTGWCVDHRGDSVCSETCITECPNGFSCTEVKLPGSDITFVCTSNTPTLCRPCNVTSDCDSTNDGESACVDYEGAGAFCGAGCSENSDCPTGYECLDSTTVTGASLKQCKPIEGECSCSAKSVAIGASTTCNNTNALGTCDGMRICMEDGLTDCTAPIPAEETCNAEDDNCDGQTDENTCADQNACTTDTCNGASGCSNDPTPGVACDDNDTNTGNDLCDDQGQCAGTPITCEVTTCVTSATPNGTDCDIVYDVDGTDCDDDSMDTADDKCDGMGGCNGTPINCPAPTQCISGYTTDGTGCVETYADVTTDCDDNDNTTADDKCDGMGGCKGMPISCPAPTQCISGYTTDGKDCIAGFAATTVGCNDNNNDTSNDLCDGAGGCSGTPITCPNATVCTPMYTTNGSGCEPAYVGNSVQCNDNNNSTNNDVCDGAGGCSGTPISCPVTTTCTPSYTANGVGCTPNYAAAGSACDDNTDITADDKCDGMGGCKGTTINCPAPTQCILGYTTDGKGCTAVFFAPTVGCNDNNNDTKNDLCDGAGGCAGTPIACPGATTCTPSYSTNGSGCVPNHAAPGTGCNDGTFNTTNDVCDGKGGCAGTPVTCPAPTVCIPSYQLFKGICEPQYAASGTSCNDGNASTINDVCNGSGSCAGIVPVVCPQPTQCITSYTVIGGTVCQPNYTPAGTGCNDGSNGTQNDVCNGAGGCTGTPIACPGASTCTPSYTTNGVGCVPNHAAAGTGCNDGTFNTTNDVCDGNGGCAGTPVTCPAPTVCIPSYQLFKGICDPQYAASGTSCNDGNSATTNDVCNGNGGCAGTTTTCADLGPCITFTTQGGIPCIPTLSPPGTPCNDGNPKTTNDVCNSSGTCSGTAPVVCPGNTPCVTYSGPACTPSYAAAGTSCGGGLKPFPCFPMKCNGQGTCSQSFQSNCGSQQICCEFGCQPKNTFCK